MSLDYRPRGSSGPMYNPERDLAHITPTVMKAAISQLDRGNRLPHVQAIIDQHGITEEQLGEAAAKFAESQNLYVYTKGIAVPQDAFLVTGFDVLPTVLQDLIFAAIGRVLTGAWFFAVRRVTIVGEEMPAAEALAEMLSVGREVARRGGYTDVAAVPQEAELEYLRHRVAVLSTQVDQQRERLEKFETERSDRERSAAANI